MKKITITLAAGNIAVNTDDDFPNEKEEVIAAVFYQAIAVTMNHLEEQATDGRKSDPLQFRTALEKGLQGLNPSPEVRPQ